MIRSKNEDLTKQEMLIALTTSGHIKRSALSQPFFGTIMPELKMSRQYVSKEIGGI